MADSDVVQIKRILVPVDFSPSAEAAVGYAHLLATALPASVTLLHVCQIPNAMAAIVPGEDLESEMAEQRAAARRLMEPLVASLRRGVPAQVETLIESAISPTEAIVRRARLGRCDLIVMSTHGRSGVSHLLMGSVAEHVLRTATCPVLIHRASKAQLGQGELQDLAKS